MPSRRRYLSALSLGVAGALSGCNFGENQGGTDANSGDETDVDSGGAGTDDDGPTDGAGGTTTDSAGGTTTDDAETPTVTPAATLTPPPTQTGAGTETPTQSATATPTESSTPTASPTPTVSPTPTSSPTPTPEPVRDPTAALDTDGTGDRFGESADTNGDVVFVTARRASVPGTLTPDGKTHIFEREDGEWGQTGELSLGPGDQPGPNDELLFGMDVAASNDWVVVTGSGGPNDPANGRAYFYERADDEWLHRETVSSDDSEDAFGQSVAMDGDRAVVGAHFGDAAYVFDRDSDGWTQSARLTPEADNPRGEFGLSVAVDGDTVLVGAPERSSDLVGAVDVFDGSGGEWTRATTITPDDDRESSSGGGFGTAVAVDGGTAVISAPSYGTGERQVMGAAYVYTLSGGEWARETRLVSSDLDHDDRFGTAVALEGDTAVVSAAHDEGPGGGDAGAAYQFTRTDDGWTEVSKLVSSSFDGVEFGTSVGLSGALTVVGASAGEGPTDSAFIFRT